MRNAVKQAQIYDAMWTQETDQYLFPDIRFAEHLAAIHWHLLFSRHLARVRGKRVLDIGCGTGWTSLLLAQRGAHVTAVDISPRQIEILQRNAAHYGLADGLVAECGDLLTMDLPAGSFDLCLGASFLHHLEPQEEISILREIYRLLAPGATAYFVDPAVNSRLLDQLRFLVPVPGRPARWSRGWTEYKARDPHPVRDNSSAHFRRVGQELFDSVDVEAVGIFNRLERLTRGRGKRLLHEWDYRLTRPVPRPLREPFCRVQIIRYGKALADH